MFIIETPSAYRFRNCVIGHGATEKDAWEDAFGPKPWSSYNKKCAKNSWSREVTDEEFHELSAN